MQWSPEILKLIYEHILSSCSHDFQASTAVLRVCRTWYDITIPILWANVVLTNWNIEKFVNLSEYPNIKFIRSLTLAVGQHQISLARLSSGERYEMFGTHNIRIGGIYNEFRLKKLHSSLSQISRILPQMPRLETFSFKVSDEIRDGDELLKFWLDRNILRQLLESLPDSVKQLELDTLGYESNTKDQDVPVNTENCLCREIAAVATRLTHLRIRLRQICPRILAPSNTLESLSINFANGFRQQSILCNLDVIRSLITPTALSRYAWWSTRSTTIQMTANARQQITTPSFDSRPYPNLKSFHIIESRSDEQALKQRFIVDHDILASTTTSMPFWERHFLYRGTSAWALQADPTSRLQLPSQVSPLFNDLLQSVEGDGAWCMSRVGARFPRLFKTAPRGRNMSWAPDPWMTHEESIRLEHGDGVETGKMTWYDAYNLRGTVYVKALGDVVEPIRSEYQGVYDQPVGYVQYEWD